MSYYPPREPALSALLYGHPRAPATEISRLSYQWKLSGSLQ